MLNTNKNINDIQKEYLNNTFDSYFSKSLTNNLNFIEYKYFNLLENCKDQFEYNNILCSIKKDFNQKNKFINLLNKIYKEKVIIKMKAKVGKDTIKNISRTKLYISLFIVLMRKEKSFLFKNSFLANMYIKNEFKLVDASQIFNPFYIYSYLNIISMNNYLLLKQLLISNINWDIEATFRFLNISKNNYFILKIFNLQKEIIKNVKDKKERNKQFEKLVLDTYIDLFSQIITNTLKN